MQKSKCLYDSLLRIVQDQNLILLKEEIASASQKIDWKEVVHKKSFDSTQHVAARIGALDILRYLKEVHHVDLEQANADGKRPLHEAVQSGQLQCLRFLLSSGVAVDSLKRADWTPLMLACTKSDLDVIKELLKYRANPMLVNKDGWNSFHIACREGHIAIVSFLLDEYPTIWKTSSNNGRTPLHSAALHGHKDCVMLLLKRAGYDLDQQDSCGTTPLMDCMQAGSLNITRTLIQMQKVNINKRDNLGRMPFHLAAQAGKVDIVNYFLDDLLFDVNSLTHNNQSALHLAAKESQPEVMRTLLLHNCDQHLKDDKNRTALDISKANGYVSCIHILQEGRQQNAEM